MPNKSQVKAGVEYVDDKYRVKIEYRGFVGQPYEVMIQTGKLHDTKREADIECQSALDEAVEKFSRLGEFEIFGEGNA